MDEDLLLTPGETLRVALQKIDRNGNKILFVVNEAKTLLGVLTDGDLRRIILNGTDLLRAVDGIFNRRPIVLTTGEYTDRQCRDIFLEKVITCIPIVDSRGTLVDFVTWDHVFREGEAQPRSRRKLSIPVVIMAGGAGTRLAPFTNVLPKPLMPIGEKTILELIVAEFRKCGIDRYYFSINYKGEMIKAYFDGIEKDYDVEYVREKEFSGTAGSLRLLRGTLTGPFFVSNCDILVRADFHDVFEFHAREKATLTIISSVQHHVIPYGVVEFEQGGVVTKIEEKPVISLPINTGVYVLEQEALDFIPESGVFHMTHLIQALIEARRKVVMYPVNEKDYVDIGQWEEYQNAILRMKA